VNPVAVQGLLDGRLRVKAGRDINLTEEVMKTHEEEDEL